MDLKSFESYQKQKESDTLVVEDFDQFLAEGLMDILPGARYIWDKTKEYFENSITVRMWNVVFDKVSVDRDARWVDKFLSGYRDLQREIKDKGLNPMMLALPMTDLAAVIVLTPAISFLLAHFKLVWAAIKIGTFVAAITWVAMKLGGDDEGARPSRRYSF